MAGREPSDGCSCEAGLRSMPYGWLVDEALVMSTHRCQMGLRAAPGLYLGEEGTRDSQGSQIGSRHFVWGDSFSFLNHKVFFFERLTSGRVGLLEAQHLVL